MMIKQLFWSICLTVLAYVPLAGISQSVTRSVFLQHYPQIKSILTRDVLFADGCSNIKPTSIPENDRAEERFFG